MSGDGGGTRPVFPHPILSAPPAKESVLRELAELSRLPSGGFAGLDSSAAPAVCSMTVPTGEQRLRKEQRFPRPPLGLDGGVQIGIWEGEGDGRRGPG
jgi:hypothetical protein